jgi:hypothetical protein
VITVTNIKITNPRYFFDLSIKIYSKPSNDKNEIIEVYITDIGEFISLNDTRDLSTSKILPLKNSNKQANNPPSEQKLLTSKRYSRFGPIFQLMPGAVAEALTN